MWIFELFERLLFYVAQIGTRSGFPDPLSPKEEQELLLRMQSGDGEARCSLIEHNLRLVAHIAKKYASGPDADDLISIGTIGLIKAVNTYDPSKSVRLAAYASRCIENEILMHLRAAKRRKNDISLQEPVGSDKEGNEISLMDILSPRSAARRAVRTARKGTHGDSPSLRSGHPAPYPKAGRLSAGHFPFLCVPA